MAYPAAGRPRGRFSGQDSLSLRKRVPGPGCRQTHGLFLTGTGLVALALALVSATPGLAQPPTAVPKAGTIIIIRSPRPGRHPRPIPDPDSVRVEFDARGTDWGSVYLDGRLIYRPHNFDRQQTVFLPPGGYYLEITGVVRSDRWSSGYLDIGRDTSQIVVIRFSKAGGVQVSGNPYVWIPD
ncbi:MAG: hypothetical protein ACFCVD_22285 [Nodosilinea sp.]